MPTFNKFRLSSQRKCRKLVFKCFEILEGMRDFLPVKRSHTPLAFRHLHFHLCHRRNRRTKTPKRYLTEPQNTPNDCKVKFYGAEDCRSRQEQRKEASVFCKWQSESIAKPADYKFL